MPLSMSLIRDSAVIKQYRHTLTSAWYLLPFVAYCALSYQPEMFMAVLLLSNFTTLVAVEENSIVVRGGA